MEFAAFLSVRDSPLTWCFDSTFRQFFPSSFLLDGCREFFSFFFFPLALRLEMKHLILALFFHTGMSWNLLDQFWGFGLFVFDLIAPFRLGCRDGKQEPAHTSQSPSPSSSPALHIQRISGVWEEWKSAEAANQSHQQFSPRVLPNTAFSARFHTGRFLSATKVTYFTPDLPHQDVQRQRAMLESLPTYNDLHIKLRQQQLHSLERDGFCIYKAPKVISQKIQLFLLF